jgi:hypothetical protein
MVQTNGLPAEVNGWEKLVYAPAVSRSVILAKYHQPQR